MSGPTLRDRNDPNRPMDFQDRLVIGASVMAMVVLVGILLWGR